MTARHTQSANLTMRMHMRRFTRLTNAFSKKIENHACAIALHAMFYNFVRIHQTRKISPAMAAGVTDRLWEMSDVVDMSEAFERSQKRAALDTIMAEHHLTLIAVCGTAIAIAGFLFWMYW
jgi:hypothetical protein